jgi:hypothetical protein
MDQVVACVQFVDSHWRPVYARPDGQQYIVDEDGTCVLGVWLIPRDAADVPITVSSKGG